MMQDLQDIPHALERFGAQEQRFSSDTVMQRAKVSTRNLVLLSKMQKMSRENNRN